jgi:calcineurin-like phosphoesterase family protein
MAGIWFTSDCHFGHQNVIQYSGRPFRSAEEMDNELIRLWNRSVRSEDTVYHIGDFTMGSEEYAMSIIEQLNGHIYFIRTLHDDWMPKNNAFPDSRLHEIHPNYIVMVDGARTQGGHHQMIVLNHYAMRAWERSHYGTWHLFGHSHGRLPPYGLSFDVGVDCWGYMPVSMGEVVNTMRTLSPTKFYSQSHRDNSVEWGRATVGVVGAPKEESGE